jgi:hypothetical protein
MDNNQQPRRGADTLLWAFASIVGLIVGVLCCFYVNEALQEEPVKKMEESRKLLTRRFYSPGPQTLEELEDHGRRDEQLSRDLFEQAEAESKQAWIKAFIAGVLASAVATFVCGSTLQWLKGRKRRATNSAPNQ